jgi:hypothetical protein
MRYMLLVIPKVYENANADFVPPADLVEKMSRFNKSLRDAGALLSLDGLTPPKAGARVKFGGTKPTVMDGPYIETKELVGGYWLIEARSQEEAIEWAKRAPMLDGDVIEVRKVQEVSDFPEEIQKAIGRGA